MTNIFISSEEDIYQYRVATNHAMNEFRKGLMVSSNLSVIKIFIVQRLFYLRTRVVSNSHVFYDWKK